MEVSNQILSDITVHMKYARFLEKEKRRETWFESVTRNKQMHINKYPELEELIEENYQLVYDKKVLPSMRSLQFGGKAIERNHARVYNCLAEETRFITSEGVRSFEDFSDGDEVLVPTHKGSWKKAKVRSYGQQLLHELTFRRGRSEKRVWATKNHRWLLREDETTSITKGDVLCPTPDLFSDFDYFEASPEERLYWCLSSISEDFREEEVWCLEVEEDHSFILSGGLVTGNCAYLPIDHPLAFAETMFLLLGGTGVGYSVQQHHVEELPVIRKPGKRKRRFVIQDSIIGWADSIKVLMKAYFNGSSNPEFDFSDIRAKGERLKTAGGKAPGPEPLKLCIRQIKAILNEKEEGSSLTSIEVHDIVCHIADAVLAGGIRRAALISLFSADDEEMIAAKYGTWWESNPQRGRANNSAVLLRHKVTEKFFFELWKKIELSNAGEPGIYFSNDKDWGTNPCCEIALRPNQFCNLVEVNASDVVSQEDLEERMKAASFLATLQAGYTDFHYLRPVWQRTTEKDALIGVSMTGIASKAIEGLDLKVANKVIKKENAKIAELIGINKAARRTCLKPSGTTSLVLGCSSGIHAWHWYHYLRRIRVMKNEAIYQHLSVWHPELVEDDALLPGTACIVVPQRAPEGAIIRNESAIDLLNRVKHYSQEWIKPGHSRGNNTHNISATISVKEDEWELVGDWMWSNKEHYNGLSVMPFNNSSYVQMPFEDCSKEKYEELFESLKNIDLTRVIEIEDNTELKEALACSGGSCTITSF